MTKPKLPKIKSGGFTLVELIVVMVIVGILAITLVNFVVTWLQASSQSQAQTSLLQTAESALDNMSTDVQQSGDVDLNNRWSDPNGPGSNNFGWQSGAQILILAKAATDSSNNIIFSDPPEYISQKDNEIYFLSGTTLYRRTLKSNSANDAAITTCPPAQANGSCPVDKTIASNVSLLTFSYYDANGATGDTSDARSVLVSITLSSRSGGKTATASYAQRMVMRSE